MLSKQARHPTSRRSGLQRTLGHHETLWLLHSLAPRPSREELRLQKELQRYFLASVQVGREAVVATEPITAAVLVVYPMLRSPSCLHVSFRLRRPVTEHAR
jgi:hypothetical protein